MPIDVGCCGTEGGCGGGQGGGHPVQQELALPLNSRGIKETRVKQVLLLLKLLSQDIILILCSPFQYLIFNFNRYTSWPYFRVKLS